ncbi:hypothetical protein OOU_Y34scaffold00890g3 [Pyricularia oryzae Y34]|uniref:Uncharacterized protein n=1 Tax=Pyricularia oryzae (strain Y34) TaxID=1143189 RepID=A0AA97NP33_PYRO3|nr:hypothetical protein OOU_Y34scaffold00890g3 [Pyricularia oryzae Y34]
MHGIQDHQAQEVSQMIQGSCRAASPVYREYTRYCVIVFTSGLFGGNAVVVSGEHTETPAPLLADDTHLGVGLPGPGLMTVAFNTLLQEKLLMQASNNTTITIHSDRELSQQVTSRAGALKDQRSNEMLVFQR